MSRPIAYAIVNRRWRLLAVKDDCLLRYRWRAVRGCVRAAWDWQPIGGRLYTTRRTGDIRTWCRGGPGDNCFVLQVLCLSFRASRAADADVHAINRRSVCSITVGNKLQIIRTDGGSSSSDDCCCCCCRAAAHRPDDDVEKTRVSTWCEQISDDWQSTVGGSQCLQLTVGEIKPSSRRCGRLVISRFVDWFVYRSLNIARAPPRARSNVT